MNIGYYDLLPRDALSRDILTLFRSAWLCSVLSERYFLSRTCPVAEWSNGIHEPNFRSKTLCFRSRGSILTNSHFADAHCRTQQSSHYSGVLLSFRSHLLLPARISLTAQQSVVLYSRRSFSSFHCLDQATYGQKAGLSCSLQSRHFRRPRNELASEWCQHWRAAWSWGIEAVPRLHRRASLASRFPFGMDEDRRGVPHTRWGYGVLGVGSFWQSCCSAYCFIWWAIWAFLEFRTGAGWWWW